MFHSRIEPAAPLHPSWCSCRRCVPPRPGEDRLPNALVFAGGAIAVLVLLAAAAIWAIG